jgi:chemotaxis protein CheC
VEPFEHLAEHHMDVLKEIGNIGAGHAATSLSLLLDRYVGMLVPRVSIVRFESLSDCVGGPEQVVAAVYSRVSGEVSGHLFFLLSVESAKKMLKNFAGLDVAPGDAYSEMERSALCEIGNIMTGSYLTSLADLTKLTVHPSVPSFAVDMAGAILGHGALGYGAVSDCALLIDTKFVGGTKEVDSHFILLPDPESFAPLFGALGVRIG